MPRTRPRDPRLIEAAALAAAIDPQQPVSAASRTARMLDLLEAVARDQAARRGDRAEARAVLVQAQAEARIQAVQAIIAIGEIANDATCSPEVRAEAKAALALLRSALPDNLNDPAQWHMGPNRRQ